MSGSSGLIGEATEGKQSTGGEVGEVKRAERRVVVLLRKFAKEHLSPKVATKVLMQAESLVVDVDLWDLYNKTRLRYLISKRSRLIKMVEAAKGTWEDYQKVFVTPKRPDGLGWLEKVLLRVDLIIEKYSDALLPDCQEKLWVDQRSLVAFDQAVANLTTILRRLSCASCGSFKSGDHKNCYRCSLKEKVGKSWERLVLKAEENVRLLISGGKVFAQEVFDHTLDHEFRLVLKKIMAVDDDDLSKDDLKHLIEEIGKLSVKTDEMLSYNYWCDDGCGRPVFARKGNDDKLWYPKLSAHCFGLQNKKKKTTVSSSADRREDRGGEGKSEKRKQGKKGKGGGGQQFTIYDLKDFYQSGERPSGKRRGGRHGGTKHRHQGDGPEK